MQEMEIRDLYIYYFCFKWKQSLRIFLCAKEVGEQKF